jgi:hypothetical protein
MPLLLLQLPKFLQPYAHILGQQKPQDEDEPAVMLQQQRRLDQEDDEEQDKADEEVRCSSPSWVVRLAWAHSV